MLLTIEIQSIKVPFLHIDLNDRSNQVRSPLAERDDALKAQLAMVGQMHAVTLEEASPGRYLIIDGFRRLLAMASLREKEGGWDEVAADIVPAGKLNPEQRFRLLREKNMFGDNPLGLHERGLFFKSFEDKGLSLDDISTVCNLPIHALNNHIKLLSASPALAAMLNQSTLDVFFAAMLVHRHQKWMQTPYAEHADAVARRLLDHANSETLNLKNWQFYLNFYWGGHRPFMAPQIKPA